MLIVSVRNSMRVMGVANRFRDVLRAAEAVPDLGRTESGYHRELIIQFINQFQVTGYSLGMKIHRLREVKYASYNAVQGMDKQMGRYPRPEYVLV